MEYLKLVVKEVLGDFVKLVIWLIVILVAMIVARHLVFGDLAHATPVAPTTTAFTYISPSGLKMAAVSWIADGVKCTMTQSNYGYHEDAVALSCVKL